MAQLQEQLEGLPAYDFVMDQYNEYAESHFNNTNPFEDDQGNRRELSRAHAEHERATWKKVRRMAWRHDRCVLGLCGVGLDCGIGLVPIAVLVVPVVGPLAMYVVHSHLVSVAQSELYLPQKLYAKMQMNILVDLLILLVPLIGAFAAWLNACLTRNAGMIFVYLEYTASQRAQGREPTYVGVRDPTDPYAHARSQAVALYAPKAPRREKQKRRETTEVGGQQSGIR